MKQQEEDSSEFITGILFSPFCSWFSIYFDFLIYYTDAIKHLSSRSERRHVDDLMSTSRVHNYMPTYISIEAISICVHTLIADPSCKLFPLLFWNVCFFNTSKACLAVFNTRYSSVISINASSKSQRNNNVDRVNKLQNKEDFKISAFINK